MNSNAEIRELTADELDVISGGGVVKDVIVGVAVGAVVEAGKWAWHKLFG